MSLLGRLHKTEHCRLALQTDTTLLMIDDNVGAIAQAAIIAGKLRMATT